MSEAEVRASDLRPLLERVEAASPVDAIDVAADELAAMLGAREVCLLIADYSGRALVRLGRTPDGTGGRTQGTENAESVPLAGTVYAEVLRTQKVAVRELDEGVLVTAPVTVRGDAIGAMDLVLATRPTAEQMSEIAGIGHFLGHVVVVNRRYTDLFEWGQRTTAFSLSAEIQRRLLPPAFTCEAGQFTVAGWLEPANTVGGDTFDYSLERETLHLSITDAAGHDVQAAMLATVLVGALRNARRAGMDLASQVVSANDELVAHSSKGWFVTGQVVRIDLDRQTAMIVNAGHPNPLRLRGGRVEEIDLAIDLPFASGPAGPCGCSRSRSNPETASCSSPTGCSNGTPRTSTSTPRSATPSTCTRARSCTRSGTPYSGPPTASCATTPPCSAWTGTATRRVTRLSTEPARSTPRHELSDRQLCGRPRRGPVVEATGGTWSSAVCFAAWSRQCAPEAEGALGAPHACGALRWSGACLHPGPSIASLALVVGRRRRRRRGEVSLIPPSRSARGTPAPDRVTSCDGTGLRTWTNGADGVPLVISNGFGAPPSAWPRLAEADCGFAAVSWWHRGLGGSERPDDPARTRVEDHAADLEATMDGAGFERAVLLGWSFGVNVAFEFARAHPERVAGILGVGGVPGGSFRAFGPPGLPGAVREGVGRTAAWLLRLVGPPAAALALPMVESARALGVGHIPPLPDPASSAAAVRHFTAHPWSWYSELLLAAGDHPAMDTGFVSFPVTLVGGTLDVGAAAPDVHAAATRIPQARFVPLVGTHFLPLEQPDALHQELVALTERSELPASNPGVHNAQLPAQPCNGSG